MNYTRLITQILPYEILVRHTDNKGDWGNWRLHSAHYSADERDQELAKLTETPFRQYRRHLNESEYNLMIDARERQTVEDRVRLTSI